MCIVATDAIAFFLSHIVQCLATKNLKLGRCLHACLTKTALTQHTLIANRLMDLYSRCGSLPCAKSTFSDLRFKNDQSHNTMLAAYCRAGSLDVAYRFFDQISGRNLVSYNIMISSLTHHGHHEEALGLFARMRKDIISMDKFTVVGISVACASLLALRCLRQLHASVIVSGLELNLIMSNVMVDAYGKCGDVDSSRCLFDGMKRRDVVSWTSMVRAYTSSCRLEEARVVFASMPERNVVSWTALISGYEQNGDEEAALGLFTQMMAEGVIPTPFTLVSILSLASEGCRTLSLMEKEYGICPRAEHYGALIDTLGRKHQLKEAMQFIECLASGGDLASVGTWGALLGACRVHGNLEIANIAAESLLKLDPKNGARYTMLSNIYAAAGSWDDVRRVRLLMKEKGLKKGPGYSWLEVRSAKHMFVAYDKSHYQAEEIYSLLATLVDHMIDARDSVEYKQCQDDQTGSEAGERTELPPSHHQVPRMQPPTTTTTES
ncbi:hypothetical protein B296_00017473 [Ensete ventricosum]|uniref:Pentatricopeptide repeat-containing protein n=1 Tax=Ensete ventricosum TaxID=4639 RepID=A0A427ABJ3_ENSVE|nr:hypothetical protein B296_00017473 [Ensete ventricosum]